MISSFIIHHSSFIIHHSASSDDIDLSLIDANTGVAGNQAFTFIGGAEFSVAGQVRYAGGILEANVGGANGNAADFQIQLAGAPTFVAGDLIPRLQGLEII